MKKLFKMLFYNVDTSQVPSPIFLRETDKKGWYHTYRDGKQGVSMVAFNSEQSKQLLEIVDEIYTQMT